MRCARSTAAVIWVVFSCASGAPAADKPIRVAQDGSGDIRGDNATAINQAIARAKSAGGGKIIIAKGIYRIDQPVLIRQARDITISGEDGTILKLSPLPCGKIELAEVGQTSLKLLQGKGFREGMKLRVMAPGPVHPFSGKPVPQFEVIVAKADADRLALTQPLKFAAPAGTIVLDDNAPNLFDISGAFENIRIANLTLDGGRGEGDLKFATHNISCGVWATGIYSYEKGPKLPLPKNLVISNCRIRNFHGRGVAFYAVEKGEVRDCDIRDTLDEAVDIDHFCVSCSAIGNTLTNCRVGVEINDGNDSVVENNRLDNCEAGIRIWRWCKQDELNVRNRIMRNTIAQSARYSIELQKGVSLNLVSENTISRPGGYAILAAGTGDKILSNTITDAAKSGILAGGAKNEIRGNRVRFAPGAGARATAVSNTGVENLVEGNGP